MLLKYDVIVIGGGHAGCEAATASATGASTLPCDDGHEQNCADELQPGHRRNSKGTDCQGNRCLLGRIRLGQQDLQVLLQGHKQLNTAETELIKFESNNIGRFFHTFRIHRRFASIF